MLRCCLWLGTRPCMGQCRCAEYRSFRVFVVVLQVWQKRWFVLEDGELSYYRSYSQVCARLSDARPVIDR